MDEEEQQQEGESSGRGKAASGRRDDQGNRSKSNLPKGSKLGGNKTKSQGVSTNSNITAGQNAAAKGAPGMKTASAAKNLARGGAGNAVQNAEQLAKEGAEELAKEGIKKVGWLLVTNPIFWVVVAVVLAILFVVWLVIGGSPPPPTDPYANPLKATFICNPSQAAVGQTSVCTLNLTYAGSADDVTAVVTIIPGGQYVSSTPNGTVNDINPNNITVSWDAKQLNLPLTAPINETYTVTIKTTIDNKTLPITYTANVANGSLAAGSSGPYVAPTANNCGGSYRFTSPLDKNFGDPVCDFTKDKLYTKLQDTDKFLGTANADIWFNKVIPCESGYNPNAYAGPSTGTPDAAGAWGLFQMGSSTPPGLPPPALGKNGPNDRGDVDWGTQVVNADTYGKKIGDLKKYWACAR